MKRNRNTTLWSYFLLVLSVGLTAQLIQSQSIRRKQKLEKTKNALLVTTAFPVYSTQIITMIMMLSEIGYKVSLHPMKQLSFVGLEHIKNFYEDLGVGDVYNRLYFSSQRDWVIDKLTSGYFDLVIGVSGGRAIEFARIKKENNLSFCLLARYTGADIAYNYEKKRKDLKLYGEYIDHFLPVSDSLKTLLIQAGISRKKITVLPTPTMLNFFSPRTDNKKKGEFRVLSVGRLVEKKGFDCAIKAFAKLTKIYPFIFYDIVGDGVEYDALSKLIRKLGCQKNVRLLGKVFLSKMPDIYSKADLLLVPSRVSKSGDREGIARVAKEAMAMNIPVVATDCSGVQEMVVNKESGFIIRPDNIKEIIDIIKYVFSHKDNLGGIVKKAREIIVDKHSLQAAIPVLHAII